MQISVIGAGYVGLVTAACFSSLGHKVVCIDQDKEKINKLQNGEIPIYEPGLEKLITSSQINKTILFSSSFKEAASNNIFFICVGTPDSNGKPDLTQFSNVKKKLSKIINQDSYIFIKSTVPIGTNSASEEYLNNALRKKSINVRVASNPEFLKEGSAVSDFLKPDRIIIGTSSKKMKSIANEIFAPFHWQNQRLIFMKRESAELVKYSSNAFLATKISFMNEMSRIAEKVGANIHEVRTGMGSDRRIGSSFLYAGLGYGGSCFPKDLNSLMCSQDSFELESYILKATKQVNDSQLDFFLQKILGYFKRNSSKIDLTIWGLSFKPGTDDIRESVSLKIIKRIAPLFNSINAYDPLANKNSISALADIQNVKFFNNKEESISDSTQALIIGTEWKEFWTLEEIDLKNIKAIFDGRNIYAPEKFKSSKIDYFGVGI
jgi:UDPglucose 6-dehydrogenase